jgi:hypothetical protein
MTFTVILGVADADRWAHKLRTPLVRRGGVYSNSAAQVQDGSEARDGRHTLTSTTRAKRSSRSNSRVL